MSLRGKIAIVEGDAQLAGIFGDFLQQADYEVSLLTPGERLLARLLGAAPDLLILDLLHPGDNGSVFCREIRRCTAAPVIVIAAQGSEAECVTMLESGCDDYLRKPVRPYELVARVNVILRRTRAAPRPADSPPLLLDHDNHAARWNGIDVELTRIEFRLLGLLASEPERCFRRDEIKRALYENGGAIQERSIDSHIRNLRRKLARAAGSDSMVRAVYGRGYALAPRS